MNLQTFRRFVGAVVSLLALGLALSAPAATITWTNTAGGSWKIALNWSPNKIPGSSDDAVINRDGNYTVTVNANASVGNLILGGGTGTPKLSITAGTFKISTNGVATVLGGAVLDLAGGILDGDGQLDVAGTMNWTKGEVRPLVHVAPAGQLNLSANNFKWLSTGIIDNEGTATWSGSGAFQWEGGTALTNRGLFMLQNDLGVTCTNSSPRPVFINQGTLRKMTTTGISTFDDVQFKNSGTLDLQSGTVSFTSKNHTFSDGSVISGTGLMQVAGATVTMSGNVTAATPIQVTAGKLNGTYTLTGNLLVNGGQTEGNITLNGNFTIAAGKDVSIASVSGNLNITGGQADGKTTVAGDLNLSAGSVTGDITVNGNLNWIGGLLPGNNVAVKGDLVWTGGTLSGKIIVSAGHQLLIPAGANGLLDGGTITNYGTISVTASESLKTTGNAFIYNYGLLLVAEGEPISGDGSANTKVYNFGTLRKTGGTTTKFRTVALNSTGTIELQGGTLRFEGTETHNLNANSQVTGSGLFQIDGPFVTLGANVTCQPAFELAGGTLTAAGTFNGDFFWSGGALSGTLTVPATRQLRLTGSATRTMNKDAVLNNAGQAMMDSGAKLKFFANATINNTGIFEIQTVNGFSFNLSDKAWFNNYGTLRKTVSTSPLVFSALQLFSPGTIDLQAGDLSFTANTHTFADGSVVLGPGSAHVSGATLSLGGAVSFGSPLYLESGLLSGNTAVATTLIVSGGLIPGNITVSGPVSISGGEVAGTLTAAQTMEWSGGTISGTLLVPSGASMTVKPGGTRTLSGVLNNAGSVTVLPSGQITLVNGTPFVNTGLFEVQDELPFKQTGSAKPVFNNAGIFRKTTSTRTLGLSFVVFQNSGTLDVQAGALEFTLNSHAFANGTRLIGAGPVRINGATVTMDTLVRSEGPFELASGFLLGNATIDGSLIQSGGQIPGLVTVSRDFTWSGGEVKGTLTASNRITWSGGWLSGTLNIPAACRFEIQDGAAKLLTGTLNNYGNLSLLALSQVQLDSGATINNFGLVETLAATPFSHSGGGLATFNNLGTFRKLGALATTIGGEVNFLNSGLLDVAESTLSFTAGSHTFNPATRINGAGLLQIAGATVSWNGAITNTSPIELVSGLLDAAGSLNGALRWSGGTLGGLLTIAPGSEVRLVGAATKTLDSVIVTNLGAMILEGSGALAFFDDAIIENKSLFELQAANSFTMPNGGRKWFNNRGNGTLRKTGSTQPFVFSNIILQNSGTLDLQAGSLDFTLNTHTLDDGTHVTGPGAVRVAGATMTLAGNGSFSQPLQLNSGILTGSATNSGGLTFTGGELAGNLTVNSPVLWSAGEVSGTLTANQTMDWSGGTVSGALMIPGSASLTVKPGGTRLLTGVLNNAGRVTILDSAFVTLVNGTPLGNSGLFEVQDSLPFKLSGSGKPVFNNSGTFRKTTDTGTLPLSFLILQNTGTVDVQAGVIVFTLNSHTLASGSRLTGSGLVRIAGASVTMNSALRVEAPFELASGFLLGDATIAGNFAMSGGQLPGLVVVTNAFTWSGGEVKGTLTASNRIVWSGGWLSGTLNVPAVCQLDLQDGDTKLLTGTLNNYGILSLLALSNVQMDSGSVINNAGLCETWSTDPFSHVNGGTPTFNNTGIFRKLGAQDATISLDVIFNHSGILDVASNVLSFISGTHTFSSGARISGAGVTRIAGATVNWNGAITNTGPIELASGSLLAAGSINGAVTWSGGTLRGLLTLPATSELHLVGTGSKTLQGITLTNFGSVFLEGSGALVFSDDAIIQNYGLFELQSNNSFTAPNSGKKWFNNFGTFRKRNSTQAFVFSAVLLQNAGTLDIQAGTIDFNLNSHGFVAGSRVTGPGSLRVDGATLTLAGEIPFSAPLQLASGTLAGSATVVGQFNWSGGTIPGAITNTGNATWSGGELSGTLRMDGTMNWSGGTISGSLLVPSGSQLAVSGSSTKLLTGTLQNSGQTTILDPAMIQVVSGTPLVNSGTFDLQSDTPLKVNSTAKPVFSNIGTLRRTVSDKVVDFGAMLLQNSGTLDLQSSDFTFSLNSHSFNDGTRTTGAGAVRVTGATLNLNGAAMLGAPFTLASGVLAGSATLNGDITLDGGTIPGNFVLNGNSTWTGSELSGSLVANGTMNWEAGLLSGSLTVPASARANVLPGGNKSISGVLQNAGFTVVSNNANIQLLGGTPLVNSGVLEVQNEQPFRPNGTTKVNFINSGTFRKTISTRLLKLEYVQLQNSGTLDLQTGELSLALNTHNFIDGTRTTGTGVVHVAGATLNVAGNLTLGPALALDSGYLAGSATLNGPFQFGGGEVQDKLSVNGQFSWTGGLLKGGIGVQGAASWTGGEIDGWLCIATNSTLAISGAATKTIKGGTLTNSGLVTVASPVTIQADGGAVIQNFGGLNLPVSVNVTTPWGGKPTLNNYGVLSLTNGFGVFNFPGKLLQFPSGQLELELAGRDAGTSFSQITGVPNLMLDGTLVVRTVGGFEPALGDRLEIIKCADRVGTFATYSANTPRLSPDYSPTNVTLFAAAPVITNQPVSQTVGDGTTVTFTAGAYGSQPMSYQWLWNGALLAGATNTALTFTDVQVESEGDYAVVVTNFWGSVTSAPASLRVIRLPIIVRQPQSQTVLQGDDAVFTVQATGTHLSYRWKFGDNWIPGATNATLLLTNVTAANAGKYKVEVRNEGGAVTSADAILTVIVPPTITEQPASKNVNLGAGVTLSVKASGTTPFSYQWLKNGIAISGANQSSFTIAHMTRADEGSYVVIIANPAGYDTSLPAVLLVNTPPSITAQPVSQTVNRGSDVLFSVTATGVPSPTYQWQLNGVIIPGATQPILLLANVQPSQSGKYSVSVENSSGAVESVEAKLEVITASLPFTDIFTNRGVIYTANGVGHGTNCGAIKEAGEPAHAGKGSAINSVWISWWAPANGIATFSTLGSDFDTVLAVYRGDNVNGLTKIAADDDAAGYHCGKVSFNAQAGTYYQIAVAGLGGACGNIVFGWDLLITAEKLPQITQAPQDYTGNINDNVAVQVLFDAFEPTAIQWFFQGQLIAGATNSALTITNLQADKVGGYAVRLTAASGRTVVSLPGDIQINTQGRHNVAARNKFSEGLDSVLSGSIGSISGPSGALVRPPPTPQRGFSGTQIFSTVGADKDPGEPDHCGEPGGASSWFFLQAPADGLIALDTEGSSFDTVLAVYTSVTMAFGNVVSVACDNDGGADGRTSKVLFPATAMTVYLIAVDGVNGANGAVNLNYAFGSPPVLTNIPASQVVPAGGNALFSVGVEADPGPVAYQWQFQGVDLPQATNAVLTLSNVQESAAGLYSVRVGNRLGTVISPSAQLAVTVLLPPAITTQPADQTINQGQNTSLSVAASGTAPLACMWWFNDAPLPSATNATLTLPAVQASQSGSYWVVVTNSVGTATSRVAIVRVVVPPVIMQQPLAQTVVQGGSITFSVGATGTSPTYQWKFNAGDIAGATGAMLTLASVQGADAGNYKVEVKNTAATVTSAEVMLTVLLPPVITTQPADQTINQGQNTSLSVVAGGTAPLAYQWWFNDAPLLSATTATLSLAAAQGSQSGNYWVVVTNSAGVATSRVASVRVEEPLRLISMALGSPAGSQIRVVGRANTTYVMQCSSNLNNWFPLATNLTSTGLWDFVDNQTNLPCRFYRALQQP